ncbi:MAG: GIY-YIG nuclease family protein, partial [bacterium]|nr:GIY-YIG nuclease family protein [bacterium]
MSQESLSTLQGEIKKLPDEPGVYFFLNENKKIVYIGRATSLRDRVRSYFDKDIVETRGALIFDMMGKAQSIEYQTTDSVLEAFILEANLIRKHQPYYNSREKDDKSYNYVIVIKEDFPRIILVRGKTLGQEVPFGKIKYAFGPFPQGLMLKVALKILRKIFPFRDRCVPFGEIKSKRDIKPCFNAQIGLCPGVCSGAISKQDYAKTVQNIRLFFEGKKATLIRKLEREMKGFAKRQEFEKADRVKRTIFALTHIQDVALIKKDKMATGESAYRIEAYDVAHTSGKSMVGVMVAVVDGEISKEHYRTFQIRTVPGSNDTAALREVLERRFNHSEWQFPDLIAVDGGTAQVNVARSVLRERHLDIPVVGVVKNERHKAEYLIGDYALTGKYQK